MYIGDIAWFYGPFLFGAYNKLKIISLNLQTMLPFREKVINDRGYKGGTFCMTPGDSLNEDAKKIMGKARAHHKTINW